MLKSNILKALNNIGKFVNKKPEICYATLYGFKINHMFCDCNKETGCKYGPIKILHNYYDSKQKKINYKIVNM